MVLFILLIIPYIIDAVEAFIEVSTLAPIILWEINHHPYNPYGYGGYDPEPIIYFGIGSYILRPVAGITSFVFGVGRCVASRFDVHLYGGEGKTRTWEEQGKSNMLESGVRGGCEG